MSLQQAIRLERIDMPITQKLRKWHFLLLGGVLVLLSGYLWYWNWRRNGIQELVCPEHCIIVATYVVGIIVLGIFIYRLNRRQLTIMLIGSVVVNLLAVLGTVWIFRNLSTFFELVSPAELSGSGMGYIEMWRTAFLVPAIYLLHSGLILLWVVSLVMFLVRKPTDDPE